MIDLLQHIIEQERIDERCISILEDKRVLPQKIGRRGNDSVLQKIQDLTSVFPPSIQEIFPTQVILDNGQNNKPYFDYVHRREPLVGTVGEYFQEKIDGSEGSVQDCVLYRGLVWHTSSVQKWIKNLQGNKIPSIKMERPTSWTERFRPAWEFARRSGHNRYLHSSDHTGIVLVVLVPEGTPGIITGAHFVISGEVILSQGLTVEIHHIQKYYTGFCVYGQVVE